MAGKAIATLFISLQGDITKFAGAMSKGGKILDDFGKKTRDIGMKMSALSVPLGAIGGSSLKMAGDFEASMNKVSALGDIAGGSLKKLEAQAM